MKIIGKHCPHFTLAVALCDALWVECCTSPRRKGHTREFPCAFHMSHADLLYRAGVRGPTRKHVDRVVTMFREAPSVT